MELYRRALTCGIRREVNWLGHCLNSTLHNDRLSHNLERDSVAIGRFVLRQAPLYVCEKGARGLRERCLPKASNTCEPTKCSKDREGVCVCVCETYSEGVPEWFGDKGIPRTRVDEDGEMNEE